jgi:Ni/Co efflux regulator RcnB
VVWSPLNIYKGSIKKQLLKEDFKMKRLVLLVVALVFAVCTTVMAAEPVAAPAKKEEAVKAEKAPVAKKEVKKAKVAKKAKAKKDEKKVVEPAAAPAAAPAAK